MDTLYSLTLFMSLTAGVMAVLLVLVLCIRRHSLQPSYVVFFRRAIPAMIGIAVVALVVSLGIHVIAGHRPGSPQGLDFYEFLVIHPAYLAAMAMPLVAHALARICRREQKEGKNGEVQWK